MNTLSRAAESFAADHDSALKIEELWSNGLAGEADQNDALKPSAAALWQARRFDAEAISHLSDPEQKMFEIFGHGPIVRPRHETIHAGFECYAAEQPDAVAVRHLEREITYGELEAQSNRLARLLLQNNIGRGDAVGLYLQRSIEMVVGILAVLKTGAAYIPQHVGVAPRQTLEHIANVTGANVILTLSALRDQIPLSDRQSCYAIDDVMAGSIVGDDAAAIDAEPARPHDRCLILFTSGTTGVPNGVQVTHRNLCNILQTSPGDLGIRPGMKVAQLLSIAFDMAAWEVLGCLSNGGTLVIRGKDIQAVAEQVDVIIATPSILCSINADRCRNVKVAAVAGEPCPRPLADSWSSFCRFYNSCGPTETTIINTAEPHYPMKPVLSIGRPTPNNTVYVLDENLKPCSIGDVGEMWAGGDCVTAGYLANDGLTRDRYRPDPFLGQGRMMFRTRDLGRWTASGELEHFGRVDDQVKIRGFRVELDAVSTVLESVEGCERAATLKYDNRNLVAFVSPATVDLAKAEEAVSSKLPYYCKPVFTLALDELPRTPRGKIDKRLLMKMAVDHHAKSDVRVA